MKKGTVIKCVKSNGDYLKVGNTYTVEYAKGDDVIADGCGAHRINGSNAFGITDDEGDIIFQAHLFGAHGEFEVIS